MNTASYVDELIEKVKAEELSVSEKCWQVAMACNGWAYVFGAYGEYCDPSNRRSRYNGCRDEDAKANIKAKCKNFNGRDDKPAGCMGCKWFLGTEESKDHEGRTRFFDCRGYIYFVLHKVCGMWGKCPAGATTMWNTASNWTAKGTIDTIPEDILVCLFVKKGSTMEHIGFGYKGQTLECSSGVQFFTKRNKKWTHWAIPTCVSEIPQPEPTPAPEPEPKYHPTIRKGDVGVYVVEMQEDLVKLGEKLPIYGVDGKFGNETLAALKSFQKKHPPLVVDGICGPKTWAVLDKEVSG